MHPAKLGFKLNAILKRLLKLQDLLNVNTVGLIPVYFYRIHITQFTSKFSKTNFSGKKCIKKLNSFRLTFYVKEFSRIDLKKKSDNLKLKN